PSHLLQYVNTNAGFATSDSEFVCVGSAIPAPAWPQYGGDSLSFPRGCAGNARLPIGNTAPVIGLWGGDAAGAPRAWRTALGFERRVFRGYRVRFDALYAHGIHNPSVTDLNLIGDP